MREDYWTSSLDCNHDGFLIFVGQNYASYSAQIVIRHIGDSESVYKYVFKDTFIYSQCS